ncbi:MAG TPA: aminopeptidase N, partial [Propionibacteriaceae bacterium]|nr:aminopeptidase N [Propionibacteriaceae bacterium]
IKGELAANVLCRASMLEFCDADRVLDTTRKGFAVFEKHFGVAYPFEKYDQVFVPEFNAGAMENAGCVTIRDEYLFRSRVTAAAYEGRDNTILHELAHMWFGDLVTMTWWDDLWLNESFAEWASHFAQGQMSAEFGGVDPWASFANARKGWAYSQDQMPTTHPIAADMVDLEAVEQNFDGITYAKGASALKQLVAQVGEEAFLAGVRSYFADHAWGNTELSDLLGALTVASGRDLSSFSGEWLEKAGVNTLRAHFMIDESDVFTTFSIGQSADASWPTLRQHTLKVGFFDFVDGVLTRRSSHKLDIAGPETDVPAFVGRKRPDLVLLNDGDLTYAKVRLDNRSLATAMDHIHELNDPLARALLWGAAWDMCRDGEMAPQDYQELVLRGIATESDLTAVGALRRQAETAAIAYTAPELRAATRERLVTGFANLLKNAAPGSDHQLAFATSLASAIDSAAGAEVLQGWLSGDEVPEGLVMDADMRWRTLAALARIGAAGEPEIAAEAERDQTITGAEQSAGVISAMADAEAKAEAWERATADPSVPNGTHQAICASFWQYGQEDILAPYADAYLEVATAIATKSGGWATRGHAASQAVLLHLFPAPVADRAFLDKVDAWLATPDLNDAVARVVRERKDLAERALRNQETSRQR